MLAPAPQPGAQGPPHPPHQPLALSGTARACFFFGGRSLRKPGLLTGGPTHPFKARPPWAQGQTQEVDSLPPSLTLRPTCYY